MTNNKLTRMSVVESAAAARCGQSPITLPMAATSGDVRGWRTRGLIADRSQFVTFTHANPSNVRHDRAAANAVYAAKQTSPPREEHR